MNAELKPPNEKLFLSHELARMSTNVFFRTQFSNHRLLGLFYQLNSNNFASCCALARRLGRVFSFLHAESAEDAENALLRSHGFRDEGLFV